MHTKGKRLWALLFVLLMAFQPASLAEETITPYEIDLVPAEGTGGIHQIPSNSVSTAGLNIQRQSGRTFTVKWLPDSSIAPTESSYEVVAQWGEAGTESQYVSSSTGWECTFTEIPTDAKPTYTISGLDANKYYTYPSGGKDEIIISRVGETPVIKKWYNVPEEYRQPIDVTVTMVSGAESEPGGTGSILGHIHGLNAVGKGDGDVITDSSAFRFPEYNSDGKKFHSFKLQELTLGGHLINLDGEQTYEEGETIYLHNTMKRSLKVAKTWAGNRDDGNDYITVDLIRTNDDTVIQTLQIRKDADGSWPDGVFDAVPMGGKLDGDYVAYSYTVRETGVYDDAYPGVNQIDHYDVSYPSRPNWQTSGFAVHNSRKVDENIETIIEIVKTWDDARRSPFRYATFTVTRLNGEDNWSSQVSITGTENGTVRKEYKFPKYNPTTGEAYIYHVQENNSSEYYSTLDKKEDGDNRTIWSFTNRSINRSITIEKQWHDNNAAARPDVTIYLLRDGERIWDAVAERHISITLEAGQTTYTFDNLPRYTEEGGREYVYSVEEDPVPEGYYAVEKGLTAENHLRATGDDPMIRITKRWIPNGKYYETLPEITLQLYQIKGGQEIPIGEPLVFPEGTELSKVFTIFNGEGYQLEPGGEYIVKELTDSGSKWTVFGGKVTWDGETGTAIITNTLQENIEDRDSTYVQLVIRKIWSVQDYPDTFASAEAYIATLPIDFLLTQYLAGEKLPALTDDVAWAAGSGTFSQDGSVHITGNGYIILTVPEMDAQGRRYTYAVDETPVEGFAPFSFESDYNFVFTNTQDSFPITARKTWKNLAQRGDFDVAPVTLTLHRRVPGGSWEAVGSQKVISTFDPAGTGENVYLWGEVSFGNWPTHMFDGTSFVPYSYMVTEAYDLTDKKHFETSGGDAIDGLADIYNTYDRFNEKTRFTVHKDWIGGTKNEIYPSVTIELYADGAYADTITLDPETGWSYTFTDLPKYKDGQPGGEQEEIVYTATEVAIGGQEINAGNSYTVTIQTPDGEKVYKRSREYEMGNNDYYAVNTLLVLEEDLKYDIIGYKAWGELPPGVALPETVTFVLHQDGQFYGRYELSAGTNWACTFKQVPYYNPDTGRPYAYLLFEENPPAGFYPLIKNPMVFDRNDQGELYAHATLINIPTDEQEVTFIKAWEDGGKTELRVDENGDAQVTLKLSFGGATRDIVLTPDGNGNWQKTVTLPITTKQGGNEYVEYTLTEPGMQNHAWKENRYSGVAADENNNRKFHLILGEDNATITVVNMLQSSTSADGMKYWIDQENAAGLRPGSLSVVLERYILREGAEVLDNTSDVISIAPGGPGVSVKTIDGAAVGMITVWQWSQAVEKFDGAGEPYIYKWREVTVPNHYTSTGDDLYSYTANGALKPMRNTLELVSLTGKKIWNNVLGGKDFGDIHPGTAITVQLMRSVAGGTPEPVPGKTAAVNAGSQWTWRFDGLPKTNESGAPYEYYVIEETGVPGYTTTDGTFTQEGKLFTSNVTNTLQPGSLTVKKAWHADGDGESRTPIDIELSATIGGKPYTWQATLNAPQWSYTFENLPIYDSSSGQTVKVAYTVKESGMSSGYKLVTLSGSGDDTQYTPVPGEPILGPVTLDDAGSASLTFNNALLLLLSGSKEWIDEGNKYTTRPVDAQGRSQLTITLERNSGSGFAAIGTETFTGTGDTWSFQWPTELPAYAPSGAAYSYRFVETVPGGYTCDNAGHAIPADGSGTLTNRLKTVDISGSKTWTGPDEEPDVRPDSIQIRLMRKTANGHGSLVDTITVPVSKTEPGEWSWKGLPAETTDSMPYIYYVEETALTGYDKAEEGMDVSNALKTVSITAHKNWMDSGAASRPKTPITLTLYASVPDGTGAKVLFTREKTVTTNPDGNWTVTFDALPMYDSSGTMPVRIQYSIAESAINGYELEGTNAAGRLPVTFESGATTATITLVNKQRTIDIKVTKLWAGDDAYWQYTRPESITFRLGQYLNDTLIHTYAATIAPDDSGKWPVAAFTNLPDADSGGKQYRYVLEENPVKGYRSSIFPENPEGTTTDYTVTNTLQTLDVLIVKTWQDELTRPNGEGETVISQRPESVTATLTGTAGGQEVHRSTHKLEPDTWQATVTGLPRYHIDGQLVSLIVYAVEEETFAAYTTTVDANGMAPSETGNYQAAIQNVLKTEDVTVTKHFEGDADIIAAGYSPRPQAITIHLYRTNGVDGGRDPRFALTKTITGIMNAQSRYTVTFESLPLYDRAGNAYTYYADEVPVPGYAKSIDEDGRTITNTLETVDITGIKRWIDTPDGDGDYRTRPQAIMLRLTRQAGGILDPDFEMEREIRYARAQEQAWSFEGLPKYSPDGTEYAYTVLENPVPGYETGYSMESGTGRYIITNTLKRIQVTVQKIWVDGVSGSVYRPTDGLDIRLQGIGQDGRTYYDETIAARGPSPDTGIWTAVFDDLPRYGQDGKVIQYTASETVPVGYTQAAIVQPAVDDNEDITIFHASITNQLQLVSLSGSKVWLDQDNQHRTRPQQVSIVLRRSYTDPATGTLETETVETRRIVSPWRWLFEDLETHHSSGAPYRYYAEELDVDKRYAATYDEGAPLDVTNTLITQDIVVTKLWEDANNRYQTRPASVTIRLTSSTGIVYTGAITSARNWTFVFSGLPKYTQAGTLITYTLSEAVPAGYAISGDIVQPEASTAEEYTASLTNALITTNVRVEKQWSGGTTRPNVTVQLLDGTRIVDSVILGQNSWVYTFTGLPKHRTDGTTIGYSVREITVPGYTTTIRQGSSGNILSFLITNVVQQTPAPTPTATPTTPPTGRPTPTPTPTSTTTPRPGTTPTPLPTATPPLYEIDEYDVPLGAGIGVPLNLGDTFD